MRCNAATAKHACKVLGKFSLLCLTEPAFPHFCVLFLSSVFPDFLASFPLVSGGVAFFSFPTSFPTSPCPHDLRRRSCQIKLGQRNRNTLRRPLNVRERKKYRNNIPDEKDRARRGEKKNTSLVISFFSQDRRKGKILFLLFLHLVEYLFMHVASRRLSVCGNKKTERTSSPCC